MFVELLLGILAVAIVADTLSKRRRNRMLEKAGIRGPKPVPILGNLLQLLDNNKSSKAAIKPFK